MLLLKHRTIAPAVAGFILLLLSACSTTQLGEVGKLAKAGQANSATLATYYSTSATKLPAVLEIEVLRSTLQPGINRPSPEMIEAIEKFQVSLRHRAQLSSDLATLYDALFELSTTDYAGGFQAASKDFYGSIGSFAEAIGQSSPITAAQTQLLDSLAGKLITEAQKRRAEKANRIVLTQLELLQPLLARDRAAVTAFRRQAARLVEEGGIALWSAGLVSAKPLLSRYGGVTGLEMVSNEASFTSANPKLTATVPALISFRMGQIQHAEDRQYAALEGLVDDLIRRHREIAEGAPVDIAALLEKAAELRALRAEFEAAVKP